MTYVTNITSEQIKAELRLHIIIYIHFPESVPTTPGFQSLSFHIGIVSIVNDFETALISLNYCVRACVFVTVIYVRGCDHSGGEVWATIAFRERVFTVARV